MANKHNCTGTSNDAKKIFLSNNKTFDIKGKNGAVNDVKQ